MEEIFRYCPHCGAHVFMASKNYYWDVRQSENAVMLSTLKGKPRKEKPPVFSEDFLQKIGETFFAEIPGMPAEEKRILQNSSGDRRRDATIGAKLLTGYIAALERSFGDARNAARWHVAQGRLIFRSLTISGGSSYDGGCHSSEPDMYRFVMIERVPFRQFYGFGQKKMSMDWAHVYTYAGSLPDEDNTEVFMSKAAGMPRLYLRKPFGLAGCYEVRELELYAHELAAMGLSPE